MRLKDSLYESHIATGKVAERKKDKKLKRMSGGSGSGGGGGPESSGSGAEKRARIKRSRNPKQPKAPKKVKSPPQSETDSEQGLGEARSQRPDLAERGRAPASATGAMVKAERDAEMSSSEGETWIADEDIMVESGE